MAVTDRELNNIADLIASMIPPSEVVYGKVLKSDPDKQLIWLAEFGAQPIPIVGFNGQIKTYDTQPGSVAVSLAPGQVAASGSLTLTTADQDVPGCSVSLPAGQYVVWGIFDFY